MNGSSRSSWSCCSASAPCSSLSRSWISGWTRSCQARSRPSGSAFGLGLISSLLGVAGGELIIPSLMFGFGAPIKGRGLGELAREPANRGRRDRPLSQARRVRGPDSFARDSAAHGDRLGDRCGHRWTTHRDRCRVRAAARAWGHPHRVGAARVLASTETGGTWAHHSTIADTPSAGHAGEDCASPDPIRARLLSCGDPPFDLRHEGSAHRRRGHATRLRLPARHRSRRGSLEGYARRYRRALIHGRA
jgi:hypothetical protein